MSDISRATFSKEFIYKNSDGTDGKIILLPLTAQYMPIAFRCGRIFQKNKKSLNEEEDSERFLDLLTDDVVKDLLEICLATTRLSVPEATESQVQAFVASHWMNMFPTVLQLNLGISNPK